MARIDWFCCGIAGATQQMPGGTGLADTLSTSQATRNLQDAVGLESPASQAGDPEEADSHHQQR